MLPVHEKNEKKQLNIENLGGTHFVPLLNLIKHTWSFYKMFHIAWCDIFDFSALCLLFFVNSLISREHLPDLVYFTTWVPHTSNAIVTRATRVLHKQYEYNTSTTRVGHKCYTNNARATRVRNFDVNNDTSENIFQYP